jgi:L-2-hydroxyglutarate oxidase
MHYDFCVIGGGIVGLATALELQSRAPGARLVLLEKEPAVGRHQTGHNSGVIHAGVYYAPGSLKARLCRLGCDATKSFAAANGIPFRVPGKLIVATSEAELGRMQTLSQRAQQNGLTVDILDADELHCREPNIVGIGALFVHETGIVDYRAICARMAELLTAGGGHIRLAAAVTAITETAAAVEIRAAGDVIVAQRLVVCGGLQSDRLARMAGIETDFAIIPFRGEYFRLSTQLGAFVNHLIYPVPDPELPFLGVHLTPTIDGSVTVGPNAVLGFSRAGYSKASVSLRDLADLARFAGFWRVMRKNFRTGVREMRDSLWKRGYLERCRAYAPSLRLQDLKFWPAGIRAQAVLADGTLVEDFLFRQTERALFVCNAPSPAATSAQPIAQVVCDKLLGL